MKKVFYYICLLLLPVSVFAGVDEPAKYDHCLSLVEQSPAKAFLYADDWIYTGAGGIPAGHCKALALLKMDKAEEAAKLLEKLGEEMALGGKDAQNKHLKTDLDIQAGLAWKRANMLDKAYMAFSSALSSALSAADQNSSSLMRELYLERGTLQILRGQYKVAIKDLSQSINLDEKNFEGYLQRAKAYRKRRDFLRARLDIRVALTLSPDQPDCLLESGIIYRETGKNIKAGQDWQAIIRLYPQSEYAELAEQNIALLDKE